jgi:nicotinate-nucleotide adenylyltransferase
MRRIGLFGGSFNPPHVAHQLVALYVLETLVDEVWFVPTYSHPFGKNLVAYDHRIAMCELASAPLGARARVSRAEQELAHKPDFVSSRTLDLIEHLYASFPEIELRLVVGTDILGEKDKWYRWDDVVAKAPLILVGRGGYEVPEGSVATGVTMPEISATHVRELLGQVPSDPSVSSLLPKTVLSYIERHGLYR